MYLYQRVKQTNIQKISSHLCFFDDGAGNPSCAVRKHLHFLLFVLSAQLLLSSVTIRCVSYVSGNSISGSHFNVRDHWVDIHSSHLLVCSATRMKRETLMRKRCESSGSRTSETQIEMGLVLCCFVRLENKLTKWNFVCGIVSFQYSLHELLEVD